MLRVKVKIGLSSIHGIGLFAEEYILKGTVTWEYDPKFDFSFLKQDIDLLPINQRDFIYYYSYFDIKQNKFVLCSDHQRFINHSTKKNNVVSTPNQDVALKDIMPGEELLSNYNEFDAQYFYRIGLSESELID